MMRAIGFEGVSSSGVPTTLNPADKSPDITLSGGNLVATKNANTAFASVRATAARTTGKYYFEITNTAGGLGGAGMASSSASLNDYVGFDANGIGVFQNGNIIHSNTVVGTMASWTAAGDLAEIAVDLGAALFWARTPGGNWNNNVTYDPATGVGGIAFGFSGAFYPAATVYDVALPDRVTINFGAAAFTGTPPSGFSPWG